MYDPYNDRIYNMSQVMTKHPYRKNWLWRLSGVKQKNEIGYHFGAIYKSLLIVSRALIPLRLIEVQAPVALLRPYPAPSSVVRLKKSTAKLRGSLTMLRGATATPVKRSPGTKRTIGIKRHTGIPLKRKTIDWDYIRERLGMKGAE